MILTKVAGGTAHKIPKDLKQSLLTDEVVLSKWGDITPLARNEWICWVISAKKQETRNRRIKQTNSKLLAGMRRPCCWGGCSHR
ncbi:MAG: YdeI/OmpD-associated family protein [Candidatus Saccharimonadales bacterium]